MDDYSKKDLIELRVTHGLKPCAHWSLARLRSDHEQRDDQENWEDEMAHEAPFNAFLDRLHAESHVRLFCRSPSEDVHHDLWDRVDRLAKANDLEACFSPEDERRAMALGLEAKDMAFTKWVFAPTREFLDAIRELGLDEVEYSVIVGKP